LVPHAFVFPWDQGALCVDARYGPILIVNLIRKLGELGNDCLETHEDVMYMNNKNNEFRPQGGQGWNKSCPYYQGGNGISNSFNPNQPSLRDLVLGQAKVNESLQKKLAAKDKSLETIQTKMDGISSAIKNQLSFNKILETQLA
jgi:hypothetical protein